MTCTCGAECPPGRYLCAQCVDRLAANVGRVPGLLVDLDDEVCRRSVKPGGPGGDGAPVAFDVVASDIMARLKGHLAGLERATGHPDRGAEGAVQRVERILEALDVVVGHPSVTGLALDLDDDVRAALRRIDQSPERVVYGRCPDCTPAHVLTGWVGQSTVRCRQCATVHDVADLQARRREAVLDHLAGAFLPVGELVDALGLMGFQVTRQQVGNWARRGHLGAGDGPVVVRSGNPARCWSVEDAVDCAEQATTHMGRKP